MSSPPDAQVNKNGYVTWRLLVSVMFTLASAILSLGWVAWQVHGSQPHDGAIREAEYERGQRAIINRLDRIEDKVDSLLEKGAP